MPMRECSHLSGRGAHQLSSPATRKNAGTTTPRMIVASITTASAVPMPNIFMKDKPIGKRDQRDRQQKRGAADDPADPAQSDDGGVVIRHPRVAGLLDSTEQEDLIVDRQAERDGAEQHDHGQVQRRGSDSQHRRQVSVLEDPDHDAEYRTQDKQIQQERFRRHNDAAREQEQQYECGDRRSGR